jgi:hypothetical protein
MRLRCFLSSLGVHRYAKDNCCSAKNRVSKQAKIEQGMKQEQTSCLQVVVKKVQTSHEVSIAVGKDALVSILGVR